MTPNLPSAYRPTAWEMRLVAAAIWGLCLLTFSLPGRVGPETGGRLDLLGLAKLGARLGVLVLFAFAWRMNPDLLGRRRVLAAVWPMLAFAAWATFSTVWSPLASVSLGQALGLLSLLTLFSWIALGCRGDAESAFVARQVWRALLVWTVAVLAINAVRPDLSGLDRAAQVAGSDGVVDPTTAGATAGLGVVLTLAGPKLLTGFRVGGLLIPALAAFATLLAISGSRTAIAMTGVVGLFALLRFFDTRAHARLLATSGAVACAYLLLDPGFVALGEGVDAGAEYVSRGQTQTQIARVSGRAELWSAIWEEVELSPWIGHGYFVTSHDGRLNVWDGPGNHTAHNVALQVLVSTGVIGAAIFAAAALWCAVKISQLRVGDSRARRTLVFAAMLGFWYLGWGQTCISFLGPIRPESIVFFTALGLAVGQVVRMDLLRLGSVRGVA